MAELGAVGLGVHTFDGATRQVRGGLPGQHAINLLLDAVLGGAGGTSTLRYDPQGKSYAAMLLAMSVSVPSSWDHQGLLGFETVP